MFVVGEHLVAVKAIGQCSEAAPRHAGDDIDGVDQANPGPVRCDDLVIPEELQNSVGERGRAGAAAGEGEDDEVFLVSS